MQYHNDRKLHNHSFIIKLEAQVKHLEQLTPNATYLKHNKKNKFLLRNMKAIG